jgi:RimJ/RimL family protein N-acetyltransferase
MAMRPFRFPDDYRRIIELFPLFYDYPEHPSWNLGPDEAEHFRESASIMLQLRPLIRIVQLLMPSLRDYLRGVVWEEDGEIVGVVNYGRHGASNFWWIGNVGVLPEYRRKGIARDLVVASIKDACRRGAAVFVADVITDNVPPQRLAAQVGFERFSGQVELEYTGSEPPTVPRFPDGYVLRELDWYDWRPRFDLAKRITPQDVMQYLPIVESRFRQPAITRPLRALAQKLMGVRYQGFAVSHSRTIVATAGYSVRTKASGYNDIEVNLDIAHSELAPYLVAAMTAKALGRRIQFTVQSWQPYMAEAALATGFGKRREMAKLGMFPSGKSGTVVVR